MIYMTVMDTELRSQAISQLADSAKLFVGRILHGNFHNGLSEDSMEMDAADSHICQPRSDIVARVCLSCQDSMSISS